MAKQVKERKPVLYNAVAAEQVASALLADDTTIGRIRDLMSPDDVPAILDRVHYVFKAAWELDKAHKPVNLATINECIARYGLQEQITNEYLYDLDKRGYRSTIAYAVENATIVRKHAVRRAIAKQLEQTQQQLESDEHDVELALAEMNKNIQSNIVIQDKYNPSFAEYDFLDDEDESEAARSDIYYFNNKTGGGFQTAKIHAVIAPPKRRKTTFIRNLMMPLLVRLKDYEHLYTAPISWFTVDGTWKQANKGLWAMAASYIMMMNGVDPTTIQLREQLLSKSNAHGFTEDEHKALATFRRMKQKTRLQMYDSSSGMKNLDRFQSLIHRDYLKNHAIGHNEGFPSILVVDFIQRFRTDGKKTSWQDNDFERAVQVVTDVAQYYGMTAFILSQPTQSSRNEQSLDTKLEDVTINDKGGGALLEACDYQWTTYYDKTKPDVMSIRLIESRGASIGEMQYNIIPSSGLFINRDAGKHDYSAIEGY